MLAADMQVLPSCCLQHTPCHYMQNSCLKPTVQTYSSYVIQHFWYSLPPNPPQHPSIPLPNKWVVALSHLMREASARHAIRGFIPLLPKICLMSSQFTRIFCAVLEGRMQYTIKCIPHCTLILGLAAVTTWGSLLSTFLNATLKSFVSPTRCWPATDILRITT